MVFPILWVLPCVSVTVGTMGFAMYTPMGFPILCVLQTALVQSMGLGEGSKTPGTETFRWGGSPPPRGLHGREFSEKLGEKS